MRARSRVIWIAGASALAVTATACGGGSKSSSNGGVPAGYYTVSSTQPQNSLQPANANETGGGYPLQMLFTGLYDYDNKTGATVPAMAESLETTDSQNYTIKVKQGWTFHNGEPVTAKSFVDAWNYGALTSNKQINADWFSDIEGYRDVHPKDPDGKGPNPAPEPTAKTMSGLKLVDDTTFTVKLVQPVSSFKAKLGYVVFSPLPQEFYKDPAKYGQEPIGNGPFQLDVKNGGWQQKKSITMKRYDGYQGTDKAKSAGAVLMFYTTPDAAYTALRDDKLDVIDKMPQVAFKSFKNDLKERAVTQPQLRIQKIHFPMYDKGWSALKDPAKVRQGLSMAINRDDIVKAMFNGDYKSATDWLATGLPGQSDVIGEFGKFDPAKAKALIEEGGGLPGGKMTISYGTDRGDKSWVDAVCSSINQTLGGQPCEGKPYPMFADMRKDATDKKMTSAYSSAWMGDYPFPDNFLADIYKTDAASNDSGYSSEAFDAKAKAAMAAPAEQSLPLWQEAQQEMKKEMPGIPLWYFVTNGGHSTKVSNVQYDLFGRPAWTEITKK